MIKKLIILLSLLKAFSLPADPFPIYFIENASLKIDADKKDWPPFLVPMVLESDSQIHVGFRLLPGEFQGRIYTFFDSHNFYFFAHVIDTAPFSNQSRRERLYKGDTAGFYLGFREQYNDGPLGPSDFQGDIGLYPDRTETIMWSIPPGIEFSGHEIARKKNDKGYTLEARIPLSNFGSPPLKEGDTLWINVSLNSNFFWGQSFLIWWGDSSSWATPKTWREAKLRGKKELEELFFIQSPQFLYTESYNRIHIFHRGAPREETVEFQNKELSIDSRGGITLPQADEGTFNLILKNKNQTTTHTITVTKKPWFHNSVMVTLGYPALSVLLPLVIFFAAVFLFIKRMKIK